jgi:hypothetical protein
MGRPWRLIVTNHAPPPSAAWFRIRRHGYEHRCNGWGFSNDAAASATNILTHRGLFIDPMFILGGAHYLSVFSAAQLQGWRFSFSKLIP